MKIDFKLPDCLVYIEIFSAACTKYGGHWQWLQHIFHCNELGFTVNKKWHPLEHMTEYYDGQWHAIWIGFFQLCWEGPPYPPEPPPEIPERKKLP